MASEKEIRIPDIGGVTKVDVIEILVKKGDAVEVDSPLVTLESDKASMDIPSPEAGIVESISVSVGDKVSEGDLILTLRAQAETTQAGATQAGATQAGATQAGATQASIDQKEEREALSDDACTDEDIYAGPGVRRMARALGVNLVEVTGTGIKSRISKEDVENHVKARLSSKAPSSLSAEPAPVIDFSRFGKIETKPLNKIKRLTGLNLHRSWITVPHVTQFDEADITDLEQFRRNEAQHAASSGIKLTLLAFVCKAVSAALKEFPAFNASLDSTGEHLIFKQYYNIGIAVDTPNGLVVPVIKDVNQLSVRDIAKEMTRLSVKAREKGLMPADMNGGCFTITSLGGIGGTAFTPIINAPEVAILGLSKSSMKPVYYPNAASSGEFKPRLMLPLSLSYDHRVIDGAEAVRFTRYLSDALNDMRRILL